MAVPFHCGAPPGLDSRVGTSASAATDDSCRRNRGPKYRRLRVCGLVGQPGPAPAMRLIGHRRGGGLEVRRQGKRSGGVFARWLRHLSTRGGGPAEPYEIRMLTTIVQFAPTVALGRARPPRPLSAAPARQGGSAQETVAATSQYSERAPTASDREPPALAAGPDRLRGDRYGASKGPLLNFASSPSQELGPKVVRATSGSPGQVATGLWLGEGGVAATVGPRQRRLGRRRARPSSGRKTDRPLHDTA